MDFPNGFDAGVSPRRAEMNSFKTFLALAALAASGYAVYLSIHGPVKFRTTAQDDADLDDDTELLAPSWEDDPPSDWPESPDEIGLPPLYHPPSDSPERPSRGGMPRSVDDTRDASGGYAGDFIQSLPRESAPTDEPPPRTVAAEPISAASSRPPPRVSERFRSDWSDAQRLLERRELAQALRLLSDHYDWDGHRQLPDREYDELVDLLDQLAGTVIYAPQPWLPDHDYTVQPGETLREISQKHNVSWQLLGKINGLVSPSEARPGDRIKVLRGPFDAVIDAERFRLTLRINGMYAGRFRVGVGQLPPEGEYEVRDKEPNPVAVDYPVGERLLDLGDGYALHGGTEATPVGQRGGRGCLALSDRDIDDVFDILSIRSPVVILGRGPSHDGRGAPLEGRVADRTPPPAGPSRRDEDAGSARLPGGDGRSPAGNAAPGGSAPSRSFWDEPQRSSESNSPPAPSWGPPPTNPSASSPAPSNSAPGSLPAPTWGGEPPRFSDPPR